MAEEKKLCLHCGKEIPPVKFISRSGKEFIILKKNKIYCSDVCRSRRIAMNRYRIIKSNPEFLEKRRNYYREWVKKNHDKFNATMREYMRKYYHLKKKEKQDSPNKSENVVKSVLTEQVQTGSDTVQKNL